MCLPRDPDWLAGLPVCSTGVRLICTNQVGNSARSTVVNTQGSSSVRCAGPLATQRGSI